MAGAHRHAAKARRRTPAARNPGLGTRCRSSATFAIDATVTTTAIANRIAQAGLRLSFSLLVRNEVSAPQASATRTRSMRIPRLTVFTGSTEKYRAAWLGEICGQR